MPLMRSYFLGSSLDDLELFEEQLEDAGISKPQIHVLSLDDKGLSDHPHLHEVQSFMKLDIVHKSIVGAVFGCGLASTLLLIAFSFELLSTSDDWIAFVFLSVALLGFCTWLGGFIGIQTPNYKFARFKKILTEGRHVFFVDLEDGQSTILERILKLHPNLDRAGTEEGSPRWLVILQCKVEMIRHS
jgi:hypothetical protein